jgi:D-alanyl-D-alanine carboxypeptidase/D-alanyl-D-alanine-endopeptidase (penicillin-binding protein 4)
VVWTAVVLVLAVAGAGATAYETGWLDGWLNRGSTTPLASPVPGFTPSPAATPGPVAVPASSPRPAPPVVRRALAAALKDPHLADLRAVVAPLTGRPVLDLGRGASMPASTLKLLTATAALEVLRPDHTFRTNVVRSGRSIVLVGGGDPFLHGKQPTTGPERADASLQRLASSTARTLRSVGHRPFRLTYDSSLFSGPAVNPHWPKAYIPDDVVSPISALWADEGLDPNGSGRVADPPAGAAQLFASYLRKDGVRVAQATRPGRAPAGFREVARVTSQPLADIVERVLQNSDNEGAEVLARQVALATSRSGSFSGGVRAVVATLKSLGVHLRNATIQDGSGLSRHDRLDAETLVQVLQLASSPAHPELRSVISGLPVAAYDGSLGTRFDRSAGRGLVRAKTGTLTGTSALAGLTTTRRGHVLLFAFVSNHVKYAETLDTRAALDALASALATCRC